MSILFEGNKEKEELLKEIIKKLHRGEDPVTLRDRFKTLLSGLKPPEIAKVEEKLIQEGMDPGDVHKFCDTHLELFKESLRLYTI